MADGVVSPVWLLAADLGDLAGQRQRRGGSHHLVVDHPDRPAGGAQPEHGLDEVAALAGRAGGSVEPAGADYVVLRPGQPDEHLAGHLAGAVDAQRLDRVAFHVRPPLVSREDVVGTEMQELGVELPAGHRQVAGPDGVDREGPVRPVLDLVDAVVGGQVDDELWLQRDQRRMHRLAVLDLDVGVLQADDAVVGVRFRPDARQVARQLASGADEDDSAAHGRLRRSMRGCSAALSWCASCAAGGPVPPLSSAR